MPAANHIRTRLRVLLLLVALVATGLSAITGETSAQAATCTWTPFTSKSSARYRLPAVVKADSGRIFVFAERRNNNYDNDDQGDFDIVMRTSVNGGCTWGKLVTVADWGTNKVSNPVPIYDRARDQVLLFSTVKLASGNKLYLQKINAAGTSISPLRSGAVSVDGWFPGLTGPGHVWLQSLPLSRLADRIYAAAPQGGGQQKGEGSLLSGALGTFFGRD